MLLCLDQDPAKRPTALELLQRLGQLVGPPSHAGRAAGSDGSDGGGDGGAPRPQMRVSVPQPGLPSPFAGQAAFGAPGREEQQEPL